MKKMKKIFAVLLTLAMVLGMNATVFAAPTDTATITIEGLAKDDNTIIKGYQFISYDATTNDWSIASWAQGIVEKKTATNEYDLAEGKTWEDLKEAATGSLAFGSETEKIQATSYTSPAVGIGAYVIIATGDKAAYTTMVANTYKNDKGVITAAAVTDTAKMSTYKVDKSADKNFVKRGDVVTFTITTTFPSFDLETPGTKSYKIVDTPDGLDITEVTSVKVGDTTLTGYTFEEGTDSYAGSYVLDLSSQIGDKNGNAGKAVVVTYKATVTSENGYTNTANAFKNDTKISPDEPGPGPNPGKEEGYTGDITVTKVDAEDNTITLNGAKFTVTKVGDTEALKFVPVTDDNDQPVVGEYKLALEGENGSTEVVATNGTVKIAGLEAGKYHFTETAAPVGYALSDNESQTSLADVEITASTTAHVHMTGNYTNLKLASLPSTGGIGTTIFTIGGCAIMIIAAGLYFATRRKTAK